jgi:hypothetical protein
MSFQQKFLVVVALSTAVAVALALTVPVGRRGERAPRGLGAWLGVQTWLTVVSVALLLVGLVSNTILRHLIQIVPLVVVIGLTARHSRFSSIAATSLFTFWIFAMGGIWLFLLGIAPVFTGRYSPPEVVLTVVIGLVSIAGLAAVFRHGTELGVSARLGTVILFAIFQPIALLLSF